LVICTDIFASTHYLGNAGDSRAVLCQKGKAVPLSVDHKPNDPEEMRRIIAGGGWVEACRVNGNLALSRALGDFIFKNNDSLKAEDQIVTGLGFKGPAFLIVCLALPDIVEVAITDEHEFIILACDGIWDVLSNEQAVAYCRKRLGEGCTPEKVI
jgi:protein phosphatase 2C family protein 2/3